jgi:hypothetical protein
MDRHRLTATPVATSSNPQRPHSAQSQNSMGLMVSDALIALIDRAD